VNIVVKMPDEVVEVINNQKNAKIIATVDPDGAPHAIHVGSINAPSNEMIVAADVFMKRTAKNLEAMKKDGKTASLLVLEGSKSFEIRCTVGDFVTSGPMFDAMSEKFKAMGLTVRGVWTFTPVEVWNEGASVEAGTKMV
jgi:predicted pyridoxine 5'-phosphate oxidase superfamily flavin-nucleotide-binding protein